MIDFVVFPLLVALATASMTGRVLDRLAPTVAARWSAVLLGAVSIAALPTFWMVGLSGVTHPGGGSLGDWSSHFLPDSPPLGAVIGVLALALAILGTVRIVRVLRTHFTTRCSDTSAFHVVDTPEVFAYTLPGPAGTIAVSRGLRQQLDDREFDIVVAHEQAHARNRHDRYLLLGLVATAAVPVLRPGADRLRFHLERWADEEAVRSTGADRRCAARTIARVALSQTASPAPLGITGGSVTARTDALLASELRHTMTSLGATASAALATVALAIWQVHHTVEFVLHTMI